MLWFDSIEAQKTGCPQEGKYIIAEIVKDLNEIMDDIRKERDYNNELLERHGCIEDSNRENFFVSAVRDVLIGNSNSLIASNLKEKQYYHVFEGLSLAYVTQMLEMMSHDGHFSIMGEDDGWYYIHDDWTYQQLLAEQVSFTTETLVQFRRYLIDNPGIWRQLPEFERPLQKIFPNELVREFILISIIKNIPEVVKDYTSISNLEISRLSEQLVGKPYWKYDLSRDVIALWAYALGCNVRIQEMNKEGWYTDRDSEIRFGRYLFYIPNVFNGKIKDNVYKARSINNDDAVLTIERIDISNQDIDERWFENETIKSAFINSFLSGLKQLGKTNLVDARVLTCSQSKSCGLLLTYDFINKFFNGRGWIFRCGFEQDNTWIQIGLLADFRSENDYYDIFTDILHSFMRIDVDWSSAWLGYKDRKCNHIKYSLGIRDSIQEQVRISNKYNC